jgi:hypothetical protein
MRVCMREGLTPRRFAAGVAAALAKIAPAFMNDETPAAVLLEPLWSSVPTAAEEKCAILDLIETERRRLTYWCESGFRDLDDLFFRDG